jgi:intein/homing endonuclease
MSSRDITHDDWVYIAGFLEGEGCIELSHRGRSVRVAISQAYPEVLDWLVDLGLGHLFTDLVQYESGYKRRFRWRIQAKAEVLAFLESVEPHLRLKKKQAQLALTLMRENRPATLAEVTLMKKLKRPPRISKHVEVH